MASVRCLRRQSEAIRGLQETTLEDAVKKIKAENIGWSSSEVHDTDVYNFKCSVLDCMVTCAVTLAVYEGIEVEPEDDSFAFHECANFQEIRQKRLDRA